MVSCACVFELRQNLLGAALQLLQLGGFALLPLARDLLFARRQLLPVGAAARPQLLRLFQAPVQFAQESSHVRARGRSCDARARFMMSSGMPRRVAMSRPADLPGAPRCSR